MMLQETIKLCNIVARQQIPFTWEFVSIVDGEEEEEEELTGLPASLLLQSAEPWDCTNPVQKHRIFSTSN